MNNNSPCLCILLVVSLAAASSSLVSGSSSFISNRPDPLRKLKHYNGGYDLRNKHYWASVVFTGIHGYTVGGIWFITGICVLVFMVIYRSGHTTSPKLLIFWLTIFAIAACSFSIAANQKSFKRSKKLQETIFGAGENVTLTIGKVKLALLRMYNFLNPYDTTTTHLLNVLGHRLRKVSLSIQEFVKSAKNYTDQALQILYMMNLTTICVNLGMLAVGLVLFFFPHHPYGILFLILCYWILTTLTWIITGVDFFFYNLMRDTCASLKEFEQSPEKSSVTEMIPCPKPTVSHTTLHEINHNVHLLIAEINFRIDQVIIQKRHEEVEHAPAPAPRICNPFSTPPDYSYSSQNCEPNTIPIGTLPTMIQEMVCDEVNMTEKCREEGRFVPESMGNELLAYSESIQKLIDIYPELMDLMECSSVKEAVSDVVGEQCKRIEMWAKALWLSVLCVSIVMVILILVLIWCAGFLTRIPEIGNQV